LSLFGKLFFLLATDLEIQPPELSSPVNTCIAPVSRHTLRMAEITVKASTSKASTRGKSWEELELNIIIGRFLFFVV
jgi:hypothetical protein